MMFGRPGADRFHQLRGDRFQQMANMQPGADVSMDAMRGDTARGIVDQLLASRGVPNTPENQQAALEYLMGGQMGALAQQGTTAQDVASQALMSEGGGSSAPPVAQSAQGGVGSFPAQTDDTMTVAPTPDDLSFGAEDAPIDAGGGAFVDPLTALTYGVGGATAGLAARQATKPQPQHTLRGRNAGGPKTQEARAPNAGLTGEVVEDVKLPANASARNVRRQQAAPLSDDDIKVEVNPPRTDNALPAPPETAAIDDPMASQPKIEAGSPSVGKAQMVSNDDMMRQVDMSQGVAVEDNVTAYSGRDGNFYISDNLADRNIRLTPDEFTAFQKQPQWKAIIINALRGR